MEQVQLREHQQQHPIAKSLGAYLGGNPHPFLAQGVRRGRRLSILDLGAAQGGAAIAGLGASPS